MPKLVFLSPKIDPSAYRNSAHHTVYAGSSVATAPGIPGPLHKLEFINGVAQNVEEGLYERLKDLGLCDTTRPKRPRPVEEEED